MTVAFTVARQQAAARLSYSARRRDVTPRLAGGMEQAQLHARQALQQGGGDAGGFGSTNVGAGPLALLPRLVAARLDVAQAAQVRLVFMTFQHST